MDKPILSARSHLPILSGADKQACARAVAVGAAFLLILCVDCAVYLALSGEQAGWEAVLRRAPGWVCSLLRACSA